jgi:hypothetical protein
LGITKHCGFTSIGMLVIMLRFSWSAYVTKYSIDGIKPINAFKTHKPMSCVRMPIRSDMNMCNPCGNQTTHFVD